MKHLKSYTLFERVSKETKLFESLNNSDFLVEEDIKELFYELTDDEEMSQCKIDNFGYRFFSTDFITRSIRSQLLYDMSFTDDWINKECKEVQDTWKNLFIDLYEPKPNNKTDFLEFPKIKKIFWSQKIDFHEILTNFDQGLTESSKKF